MTPSLDGIAQCRFAQGLRAWVLTSCALRDSSWLHLNVAAVRIALVHCVRREAALAAKEAEVQATRAELRSLLEEVAQVQELQARAAARQLRQQHKGEQ